MNNANISRYSIFQLTAYTPWFKHNHIMARHKIYWIRNAKSGVLNSWPVCVCGGITYFYKISLGIKEYSYRTNVILNFK
jgi:hypothetical protein